MTTNKETEFSCVDCHVQKCEKRPDRSGSREGFPQFCVTPEIRGDQKKELLKIYSEAKNAQIMKAAAEVELKATDSLPESRRSWSSRARSARVRSALPPVWV